MSGLSKAISPSLNRLSSPDWVRLWLWALVLMVIIMVAIGGATRLTGSGLSITEWKPITGALPPLTESAWLDEFNKYRASPQYELLNAGLSLAEFKFIYWWEWGHRQFGRFMGLIFLGPFLLLVWRWKSGRSSGRLIACLCGLAAIGALQAAVGWIMVASGLEPGMTAVEPVKLMLHLLIASALLSCLVYLAQSVTQQHKVAVPDSLKKKARFLFGITFLQIALGALVAGSHAGLTYNTWPLMDGHFIPPVADLLVVSPWYENFFDNVTMVQFLHRMTAYGLIILALIHAYGFWRVMPQANLARQAALLAGCICLQALLGIVTLLLSVPLWAGLLHQILAMVTLSLCAYHLASMTGLDLTSPVQEAITV